MNRTVISALVVTVGVSMMGLACSKEEESAKGYIVFGEFVNPQDTLPRIRFFDDGLVSLNDRCPVRKVKLNPNMPAVYVNGQPIGFC